MTAQLPAKEPTISILLYTDDPNAISDGKNLLGLGSMIERLKAHAPVFANLSIKWVSRSSDQDHHADNKLHDVLCRELEETGEPFDEIWFFGLHQANTEKFSLGVFRGGPESELTSAEVEALDKWMKVDGGAGGGVLMTGDHNNPAPPNWLRNANGPCDGASGETELLGLGRAIGRCVPRAGELRQWDGPPSSHVDHSLNTLAKSGFQTDRVPQKLIHEIVNVDGEPDPAGTPHPLFFYRPGRFIDTFPDHRHEGLLVMPDLANTDIWPVGPTGQPKPCVVAFGTNRRSGQRISLVTTYDGDRAGVGRIVADSSWHHYVNINLKGFPHPAAPKTNSDKIGQFYGNLAIWLAPIHKRRQMAQAMYWELADHTLLLEQYDDPFLTGDMAYSLLNRSTSPCEIHELLRAFGRQEFAERRSSSDGSRMADLANREKKALGLVVDSYQKAMIQAAQQATVSIESLELEKLVSQGLTKTKAAGAGSGANAGTSVTSESLKIKERRRSNVRSMMENKEWTIDIKRDSPVEPQFAATLVFSLNDQDGVVTGQVWNGIERKLLSDVSGTHKPLPGAEHWFMALEFKWGDVNMSLSGVTVETPETVLFNGRYRASTLTPERSNGKKEEDLDVLPLMAPGDGDTGSGTGQQT